MYKMSEQCRISVEAKFKELVIVALNNYMNSPEFITKATELLAIIDADSGTSFSQEQVDTLASMFREMVGYIITNTNELQRKIAFDMYCGGIEQIINNTIK
jgi:hypothetical protein